METVATRGDYELRRQEAIGVAASWGGGGTVRRVTYEIVKPTSETTASIVGEVKAEVQTRDDGVVVPKVRVEARGLTDADAATLLTEAVTMAATVLEVSV